MKILMCNPSLYGIFYEINPWMHVDNPVAVLSKKNYGWMEYVNHQPASQSDAESYYYNIGMLLGACYILNGQDMHYENVIACGKHPFIIDLECLFSPPITQKQYEDKNYPSITETLIIPYPKQSDLADLDFSSLLNHKNQKSLMSKFIIKGNFVDNVYVERETLFIIPGRNVLFNKVTGEAYSPSKYRDKIATGYLNFMSIIFNNKNIVLKLIKNTFFGKRTRVIFRPTFLYSKLLLESYHPKLLANKEIYYDYLKQLLNLKSDESLDSIFNYEIADLLNGDIPSFTSSTSELFVENSDGIKIDYQTYDSGFDRVLKKIENLNIMDIKITKDKILSILEDRYV